MTDEKKTTIVIGDVEYTEEQLSDRAKDAVNHIANLERKISNTQFQLDELIVNKGAYIAILKGEVEAQQVEAAE
jgi:hypothetical protein